MVLDGYGFHEGFFWPHYIREHSVPERISGYALRAFDHGLGRAIWFINAGEVQGIATTIAAFPPARHSDLWSGIGLACAYAGAVERPVAEDLRRAAGAYASYVAMGIAVAAKMRQHAPNPAPHTEIAAHVFWQMSAAEVAALADQATTDLPLSAPEPAYELWRQRIRMRCA
jgi:hypothetical protein